MLEFHYGLDKEGYDYKKREAVRAIVKQGSKVLMIKTKLGNYMFPGGGIEENETDEEALVREVKEETGYIVSHIHKLLCITNERKIDYKAPSDYINLINRFYVCQVSEFKEETSLESYEKELSFEAIWTDIDKAIESNRNYRKKLESTDIWLLRTVEVLELIRSSCFV